MERQRRRISNLKPDILRYGFDIDPRVRFREEGEVQELSLATVCAVIAIRFNLHTAMRARLGLKLLKNQAEMQREKATILWESRPVPSRQPYLAHSLHGSFACSQRMGKHGLKSAKRPSSKTRLESDQANPCAWARSPHGLRKPHILLVSTHVLVPLDLLDERSRTRYTSYSDVTVFAAQQRCKDQHLAKRSRSFSHDTSCSLRICHPEHGAPPKYVASLRGYVPDCKSESIRATSIVRVRPAQTVRALATLGLLLRRLLRSSTAWMESCDSQGSTPLFPLTVGICRRIQHAAFCSVESLRPPT